MKSAPIVTGGVGVAVGVADGLGDGEGDCVGVEGVVAAMIAAQIIASIGTYSIRPACERPASERIILSDHLALNFLNSADKAGV